MNQHAKAPSSGRTRTALRLRRLALLGALALLSSLALAAAAVGAVAPTLTVGEADPVGYTSATLHGAVDPEGGNQESGSPVPIGWELQLSTTPAEGFYGVAAGTIEGAEAEGSDPVAVSAGAGGLTNNTTYYYRLVAYYAGETATSAEESFTTDLVTAPAVEADDATAVTATSAHFSGRVTLGNADPAFFSSCHFDYVAEAQFDQDGFAQALPLECQPPTIEGADTVEVAAEASDLLPGTTYHLRLRAANGGGSSEDVAATFTTLPAEPLVGRTYVTAVGTATATLNAQVNPRGAPTTYRFEYVTQAQFEADGFAAATSTPESAPIGADNSEHLASAAVAGLEPGTSYRYRALATNSVQTTAGPDRGFVTEAVEAAVPDSCPNAGARAQTGSQILPACRAWEMVSPPDKNGGAIASVTGRTKAASDGGAVTYISLASFGGAAGTGVESEYMAQRTAAPGTPGWATHGLIPKQEPLNVQQIIGGLSPGYVDPISPDLSTGILQAPSPLTEDPEVVNVPNIYLRRDLRAPGEGTYSLLSECPACDSVPLVNLPYPLSLNLSNERSMVAGASADFEQVLFESRLDLTGDGAGVPKLYLSDGGAVRLVGKVPPGGGTACGGGGPDCVVPEQNDGASIAGLGTLAPYMTPRVISADGSLVNFSAPVVDNQITEESNLYQYDSHGTSAPEDDTVVRLNVSERSEPPGDSGAAIYQTASSDGSRVFFASREALTDDAVAGYKHLYMWRGDRLNDEVQRLHVSAAGGSFTLSFGGETTAAQAAGAPASALESALEALGSIGAGNVAVSGGPGEEGDSSTYLIAFEGALAEEDVALIEADGTGLTGAAASATVEPWIAGEGHLTLIDRAEEPGDNSSRPERLEGMIGASDDGSHVYFVADGRLVPEAPPLELLQRGIYLWHEGEITYIGAFTTDTTRADWVDNTLDGNFIGSQLGFLRSRVSGDGRALLIMATNGAGLTGYDHNTTGCGNGKNTGCMGYYLYRAESDELACATCNPSGEPPSSDIVGWTSFGGEAAVRSGYLNHPLSEDGRWVFFTTREALVARDTNGRLDPYQYDSQTGRIRLLSSGTSPTDSYFLDAGADGEDVFFTTEERLVGWDVDSSYDLYDARVGGGVPEPARPGARCDASTCQGPPPAAPADNLGTPSSSFRGPGDVRPNRKLRCGKGKRKVYRKGKARCVKKHRKQANQERRAGR